MSNAPNLIGQPVQVRYTNHRGETSLRSITPIGVVWGWSKWHGGRDAPAWLLQVWDHDRAEQRTYALADCDFTAAKVAP